MFFIIGIWTKAGPPNIKKCEIFGLCPTPYVKWCKSFQCRCVGPILKIVGSGNWLHPKLFGDINDLKHTLCNFDYNAHFLFRYPILAWDIWYDELSRNSMASQKLLKLVKMYSHVKTLKTCYNAKLTHIFWKTFT